jgi:hypothetical protein
MDFWLLTWLARRMGGRDKSNDGQRQVEEMPKGEEQVCTQAAVAEVEVRMH